MKVGYARVSTQDQDTAMQLDALLAAGCELVYEEKASGSTRQGRVELERCIAALQPGDVLVCYKIDRVARSLSDLLDILRQIDKAGATIKSLTEPIDTTNSMGLFVIQILGAVAQLERAIIRERCMAGQQAAKARGKSIGCPRRLTPDQEAEIVLAYRKGGVTYRQLGERYGLSAASVCNVMKRAI